MNRIETHPLSQPQYRLGTAGWTIPREAADEFAKEGAGLARYAARFNAVEINSTFHRAHRRKTLENWAAIVPSDFRFAVKLRKIITHELRLVDSERELEAFVDETSALATKLGPLLIQLPPSLSFDAKVAHRFFTCVRSMVSQPIACEPRHESWFSREANQLLRECRVARVAADPARVPEAANAGGWEGFRYFRLHGSPTIYRSSYSELYLSQLRDRLGVSAADTWCIFDNTASGAACQNALRLAALLGHAHTDSDDKRTVGTG